MAAYSAEQLARRAGVSDDYVRELCEMQIELCDKVSAQKVEFVPPADDGLHERLSSKYYDRLKAAKQTVGKQARADAVANVKSQAVMEVVPTPGLDGLPTLERFQAVWHDLEQRVVRDNHSELSFTLTGDTALNKSVGVTFRLFDEGLGFRYAYRGIPAGEAVSVTGDRTQFHTIGNYQAWWYEALGQERDEYLYTQTDAPAAPAAAPSNEATPEAANEPAASSDPVIVPKPEATETRNGDAP